MTPVNPHLLPVIAPPDLPEIARDAIDRIIVEAQNLGIAAHVHAGTLAAEMIGSGRWCLDPTNDGDLSVAEWAMRKLAEAQAELRRLEAARAEFHDEIEKWFHGETSRANTTVAFFGAHLEHYQRRRRAADDKVTQLRLPSGLVKSTRYQPAIEVDDEAAVIAWAIENGFKDELVHQPPATLKKAGLNRIARPVVVTEDGKPDGPIVESYVEIPSVDDEPETRRVPGVHVKAGHVDVKVVPR